ncbi:hypothetical protein HYQ46_013021 [Verticillium longisporum]|nr:hypothetical protein HYQ46_013021 [Verticillium longisporum]
MTPPVSSVDLLQSQAVLGLLLHLLAALRQRRSRSSIDLALLVHHLVKASILEPQPEALRQIVADIV